MIQVLLHIRSILVNYRSQKFTQRPCGLSTPSIDPDSSDNLYVEAIRSHVLIWILIQVLISIWLTTAQFKESISTLGRYQSIAPFLNRNLLCLGSFSSLLLNVIWFAYNLTALRPTSIISLGWPTCLAFSAPSQFPNPISLSCFIVNRLCSCHSCPVACRSPL